MKRIRLSPVTFMLMSLSLVVGILVCDLSGATPTAHAQTGAPRVFTVAVPAATLSGSVIAAKGIVINGVATDAVFMGGVQVSDSVVQSVGGMQVFGAFPSGTGSDLQPQDGAFPSGGAPDTIDGAFPSGNIGPANGAFPSGNGGTVDLDGAFPSGNVVIYSSSGLMVTGGTLQGSNIQVVDGVVSGENLVLVGACVTSAGAQ